jgi:hypothetical protein
VSALVLGALLVAPAVPAGAVVSPPLASATSTPDGSWVVLPMGDLTDESNTFWQLFQAAPGSSRWSLVTPQGTADNGGLVAGASSGSILAGVVPSGLLRFSPLSLSNNGGSSWSPAFLPGGLAAGPDALALQEAGAGGALAIVGGKVLAATKSLASWTPLVSAAHLGRVSRTCGVTAPAAVAITATGTPLVATGCRRGGIVGIFTPVDGSWHSVGGTLEGKLRGAATTVLRLETPGSSTIALVSAGGSGQRELVGLRGAPGAPWTVSTPLALAPGASVMASAVGADGRSAVLVRSKAGSVAYVLTPGGRWSRLPPLPAGTAAVALPDAPPTLDASPVDAFTVHGGSLGVYALTPSGTGWARVQSSQVPISYGSSS